MNLQVDNSRKILVPDRRFQGTENWRQPPTRTNLLLAGTNLSRSGLAGAALQKMLRREISLFFRQNIIDVFFSKSIVSIR